MRNSELKFVNRTLENEQRLILLKQAIVAVKVEQLIGKKSPHQKEDRVIGWCKQCDKRLRANQPHVYDGNMLYCQRCGEVHMAVKSFNMASSLDLTVRSLARAKQQRSIPQFAEPQKPVEMRSDNFASAFFEDVHEPEEPTPAQPAPTQPQIVPDMGNPFEMNQSESVAKPMTEKQYITRALDAYMSVLLERNKSLSGVQFMIENYNALVDFVATTLKVNKGDATGILQTYFQEGAAGEKDKELA